MRDKNRIPQILEQIRENWENVPDMRLGQIIYIIAEKLGDDMFFIEDEEFVKLFAKVADKASYIEA